MSLVLNIAYASIWVFAYTTFKHLLKHSKVSDMEPVLNSLIAILVLSTTAITLNGIGIIPDAVELAIEILFAIIAGGLSIWFGIKLTNLKTSLYGSGKLVGYMNIFTGICVASIILLPIGLLLQIATDIVTAILFDKASREVK